MTARERSLASASSSSISGGNPKQYTGMSAEVLGLTAARAEPGSMVKLPGRQSQKTGSQPARAIAWAEAAKVKLGTIISPVRPRPLMARMSADVQLEKATASVTPA